MVWLCWFPIRLREVNSQGNLVFLSHYSINLTCRLQSFLTGVTHFQVNSNKKILDWQQHYILYTLCGNGRYKLDFSKIYLQPLITVLMLCTPATYSSPDEVIFLVQSSIASAKIPITCKNTRDVRLNYRSSQLSKQFKWLQTSLRKCKGPLEQVRPVLRIHFHTSTPLNNAILIEGVTSQCESIRRKQTQVSLSSLSVGFRVCIKILKMARDESHVLVLLILFFILRTI